MTTAIKIFTVFLLTVFCSVSFADNNLFIVVGEEEGMWYPDNYDFDADQYVIGQNKLMLTIEGTEGIWFNKDTTTKMLIDLDKKKKLEGLVVDLELKLSLKNDKIYNLNQLVAISVEVENDYKKLVSTVEEKNSILEQENKKLKKASKKWYNSKLFWFTTGFVACSLAVVGSTVVYKRYVE